MQRTLKVTEKQHFGFSDSASKLYCQNQIKIKALTKKYCDTGKLFCEYNYNIY